MKHSSLYMMLIAAFIAVGSATITIVQAYHRDNYNDGAYRRGGLFGSGGVLGTGIGADRPYDYYSVQPSVLQRTGNVAEDIVEGTADTAAEVVEDITDRSWYSRDPYYRTGFYGEPYRREGRFVRPYSDDYRMRRTGR